MTIIPVPRPSAKAMDPDRAANALLLAQIQHLQHAERRLPLRYRSKIYTHAIRTEGEAALYIREVTEAIHKAHDDAAVNRARRSRADKSSAKAKSTHSKNRKGSKRGRGK
jgi:hypothetical protein